MSVYVQIDVAKNYSLDYLSDVTASVDKSVNASAKFDLCLLVCIYFRSLNHVIPKTVEDAEGAMYKYLRIWGKFSFIRRASFIYNPFSFSPIFNNGYPIQFSLFFFLFFNYMYLHLKARLLSPSI